MTVIMETLAECMKHLSNKDLWKETRIFEIINFGK